MNKRSVYIAGPMTGYSEFNFPAFFDAEEDFRSVGWDVYNPAQHDLEVHRSIEAVGTAFNKDKDRMLRDCLLWDLSVICDKCDAIAMLPGWERSYGARAEHATAVALGLTIIYL